MIDYYKQSENPAVILNELKGFKKDSEKLKELYCFLESIFKNNELDLEFRKRAKELSSFLEERIERERRIFK